MSCAIRECQQLSDHPIQKGQVLFVDSVNGIQPESILLPLRAEEDIPSDLWKKVYNYPVVQLLTVTSR